MLTRFIIAFLPQEWPLASQDFVNCHILFCCIDVIILYLTLVSCLPSALSKNRIGTASPSHVDSFMFLLK
jgi:hypothetical protein